VDKTQHSRIPRNINRRMSCRPLPGGRKTGRSIIVQHACRIELSESALRRNLRFLRRQIGTGVRLVSVVKANAYGHGLDVFVPLAENCGQREFAVFSATEAAAVIAARTHPGTRVMIMGHIENGDLDWAIANDVAFYVFNLHRLDGALRAAQRVGRPARIHLELETGLHRTGFNTRTLPAALKRIAAAPDLLRVEGVCTHFAGAESLANHYRIRRQIETFASLTGVMQGHAVPLGARHSACSAAALNYPETRMDLVRIGIAQYGFWPSQESRMEFLRRHDLRRNTSPLERILSWKSRVMDLKSVPAGEYVGYGNLYLTTRRQRLAAVPTGYHHGFARTLSNLGHVLIRGHRCPVAGVVNMNMLTADVTDAPGVAIGDEVVLIGTQGRQEVTVGAFGEMARDLNYEVLVRLPAEIPRIVVA